MDCFGVQEIFLNCANYLKPSMPFVTVGPAPPKYTMASMLYTVGQMLSNMLWPRLLGGVNRPYVQAAGIANLLDMERLARMATEGKLKVPIDSCWDLEDVLKVCYSTCVGSQLTAGIGLRENAEQAGKGKDYCQCAERTDSLRISFTEVAYHLL
jgi:hypothetical protein